MVWSGLKLNTTGSPSHPTAAYAVVYVRIVSCNILALSAWAAT